MASPNHPRPKRHDRAVGTSVRLYRSLLRVYPRELRDGYGDEMSLCFRDLCRDELRDGGSPGLAALWARTLPELLSTALKERLDMLSWNVYRTGVVLVTALILLVPLLAMQFTDEVVWDATDFAVAGVLLVGAGLAFELVARKVDKNAYRVAVGLAVAAALLLVWVNLAVGLIGSEDDPANMMYIGVLAIGFIGVIIARFQPHGMARALYATALAQALAAAIAMIAGWGSLSEILGVNALFVVLFTGSALLFQYAAQQQTPATAEQQG